MDTELPNTKPKQSSASAPKAQGAASRKSAHLQGFSAPPLGQFWPTHWPKRPGAKYAQPGAFLPPPEPPFHGSCAERGADGLGRPLGIREVAALIGCSPWTVRQTLIPRGLPFFRSAASGRLIFYTNQVVAWIENQQGGISTQ